jgi:hypothetical protein
VARKILMCLFIYSFIYYQTFVTERFYKPNVLEREQHPLQN